jgi:hypothetical protein
MNKIILCALVAILAAGCTTHTEYGECIGVLQDKKPDLEYKLSGWNTFLAVIFSETIVVPIVVVADDFQCPVGKK